MYHVRYEKWWDSALLSEDLLIMIHGWGGGGGGKPLYVGQINMCPHSWSFSVKFGTKDPCFVAES